MQNAKDLQKAVEEEANAVLMLNVLITQTATTGIIYTIVYVIRDFKEMEKCAKEVSIILHCSMKH